MAKKLYGTDPDQVPTNADLGTMAYQDKDVEVDTLGIGTRKQGDEDVRFLLAHDGHGIAMDYTGATLPKQAGLFTASTAHTQTAYGDLNIKARTDYGGYYGIGFFTASSNNTPVRRAYFNSTGNLVFANGLGIDFSATGNGSGTMSSEVLDDYEEGTWSPSYRNGGTEMTYTMGNERAEYRKIGDTVWIHLGFRFTALSGTSTGAFRIYGLPYTAKSNGAYQEYRLSCALGNNVNTANSYKVFGFTSNGHQFMEFRIMDGGDTVFRSNEMDSNTFMSVWGFYVVA